MTSINISRIKRIHRLIQMKATGNTEDLAERLEVSQRMVYHYINWMKENGAPIAFCRVRGSYVYEEDVKFNISFEKIDRN